GGLLAFPSQDKRRDLEVPSPSGCAEDSKGENRATRMARAARRPDFIYLVDGEVRRFEDSSGQERSFFPLFRDSRS
ncbi:hypothetical protein K0M31_003743, partial [Melipona bicolor]